MEYVLVFGIVLKVFRIIWIGEYNFLIIIWRNLNINEVELVVNINKNFINENDIMSGK